MEAISYLSDWVIWLLVVIPVGAGAMVTYLAFQKSIATDSEQIGHYNTRIKNTIKGAIVGMTISGFITLIKSYFGM